MSVPLLSLSHAAFGYEGRAVVHDVSFTLGAGEVVALLGPNGSGKSTLVQGVLGLNDHLGGSLERGTDPHGRRPLRIGYVPQRHSLDGGVRATVREVVATGRLAARPWWRPAGAADRAAITRALDLVGLADRAGDDVAELSGGQQRRVLIARALAGDDAGAPLIMDEPTAGVDAANQQALAAVLSRLADAGRPLLVVTHELTALADVVTRVLVMHDGRLVTDVAAADYRPSAAEMQALHAHHHDPTPTSTDGRGRVVPVVALGGRRDDQPVPGGAS